MTDFSGSPPSGAPKIEIEMWTDLGCPWCYVGKHRLQRAIGARPDAGRFVIRLRSFELNPTAPREPETIESAFIRSHGGDATIVVQAERRIQALAQDEGLEFSLERLNANTFDVHRLLHHAEEEGMGLAFFSLVQDRFFEGRLNPFDADDLTAAAEEVGLSGARVRGVLASDEYAGAVRADREEVLAMGAGRPVHGVRPARRHPRRTERRGLRRGARPRRGTGDGTRRLGGVGSVRSRLGRLRCGRTRQR